MNARVRLVSSETVAEDANIHDAHENAEGRDEAPIGLPEEGGSNRNDGLGEAPPPLIAEREDRAVGVRDANAETKKGIAKLIAFVWPPKVKAPRQLASGGDESEGEGEGEGGERRRALTASRQTRLSRRMIVLSSTAAGIGTAPQSRRPPKHSVRS